MSSPTTTVGLLLLLLTGIVSTASGVQKLTITPDKGTTFNITSTQVKGCQVCTGAGRSRRCDASLLLKDNTPVSVEFECPRPQDAFKVEISRNIECTTKSCTGHIIQADFGSLPLLDFNRKFTWNLKAAAPKAFKIDFSGTGLRQINPSESCPDRLSYTLQALQTTGSVAVGKYCRAGAISSAQILILGSFSLEVPGGQKPQNSQFDVSVGEEIKSLAKITLTLPKGTSSSVLLSPNYPDSFPDDDLMEWYFHVPDQHKTAVRFFNLTQPSCLKKETAVEYHSKGRAALVRSLNDPHEQRSGDFSMTLRNCEMERRRAYSPGLSVKVQVSTSSARSSVLCKVDLSKAEGLVLYIKKLRPTSACEMKINSVTKENITVTSNSELSFQGCTPEDVEVTAMKVIDFLLTTILSVVAALLVIFIIVLVVVCLVIRKKKKLLNHQVSIYNPNGTSFLPGQNNFPKSREDNESHVYASIEDTLVYTHLLRKGMEIGIYGETDTYRSFAGHTDSQKPLVSKTSSVNEPDEGVYRPFSYPAEGPPLPNRPPSHELVDNEIYQSGDPIGGERSPSLGPRLEPEGGN
ncbi:CUB domain-containing protein 1 [Hippoglossus stenolepis]|uniref:CUB domain-containing protein 1 n=1 Tax=Hippoglossus stenolepis TaxID=195615 RepID=UPI00159C96EB|nr:CUB domain-containing protein 1 [Hippoglossus stenolepis]